MTNKADETLKINLAELLPLIEEQLEAGKEVRFGPKGVSMLPMLRQGIDTVVLKKPDGALKKYDLPLYRRDDGKFILHRIVSVNGEEYITCGDNQTEREFHVKQSQIIGVVIAYYRGDEYISCDSSAYKRYCRHIVQKRAWQRKIIAIKRTVKKYLVAEKEN